MAKRKRKRRRFTPEFKAKVVLESLPAKTSQAEVCRRHNISEAQLSKWKRQLLENAETLFDTRPKVDPDAAKRIADLEKRVEKLRVGLDIHKKVKALLDENRDPDAQGEKGSSE